MKKGLLVLSLLALLVSCRSLVPTTVFYKDGTQEEGVSKLTERKKNIFSFPFKSLETGDRHKLNPNKVEKVLFRDGEKNYFGHVGLYRFVPIQYKIQPILVREIASGDKLSMYINRYKDSSSTTNYDGARTIAVTIKKKFYVKDIDSNKAFLYSPLWHGEKNESKVWGSWG